MSGSSQTERVWVHSAADNRRFTIRRARSLDELELCTALQQQIWGYSDLEVVPRNIYVLAQALGGHVLCAWDARGEFSGFAMAVAAHEPALGTPSAGRWMAPMGGRAPEDSSAATALPEPYLHSHLVAIAPQAQRCGLGFALKFAQRDLALAAGLRTMRWTFDPMMSGNAGFNLGNLGVVVRRYVPDFYGRLGSVLQGDLPTDRLLAEWRITSARVRSAWEHRLAPVLEPALRIELSHEIRAWKQIHALPQLEEAQRQLRQRFTEAFAQGLVVTGFARDAAGGGAYLLEAPRDSDEFADAG